MLHRSFDLIVVVTITILGIAFILMGVSNVVARVIFTLPLVLVLPGYALTAAMFPRRILRLQERILFSLGLSLTITVLGGLALNWTPWGLRLVTWVVFLGSVILGASAVALVRRQRNHQVAIGRLNPALNVRQGLLLLLAVMVACASIGIVRIGTVQQHFPGFTQFWILPADEVDHDAVRLGVQNIEATGMRYSIQVEVAGLVVYYWPFIELKPDEQWETIMLLPREQYNPVEAVLYLSDAPDEAYRHVVLWRNRE